MSAFPAFKPVHAPDLRGKTVALREIALSDVGPRYVAWLNDPEVMQFTESRFQSHDLQGVMAYVSTVLADRDSLMWAVWESESGGHVGNIKLGGINWTHRFADIGILIGERSAWGRGYATEAITLVCGYAFGSLKLHKLMANMYVENVGSRRAFEKAGFTLEGYRRSQYLLGGKYTDCALLGKVAPA